MIDDTDLDNDAVPSLDPLIFDIEDLNEEIWFETIALDTGEIAVFPAFGAR